MRILLDSTVLIDVLRSRNDSRAELARLVESGHILSTSTVNVAEIHAGMRPAEEAKTKALLSSLECYPLTEPIAVRAGSLKRAFAEKGQTLTLADMMIAATALEHGIALMTDNRKDFPVPGLKFHR